MRMNLNFSLECKPAARPGFFGGEPQVVICTLTNISKSPKKIGNSGLDHIHGFSFALAGSPCETKPARVDGRTFDGGMPKIEIESGKSVEIPCVLQGWLDLPNGVSHIAVEFKSPGWTYQTADYGQVRCSCNLEVKKRNSTRTFIAEARARRSRKFPSSPEF